MIGTCRCGHDGSEVERWEDYAAVGVEHIIVMTGDPFAVDAVLGLVEAAKG